MLSNTLTLTPVDIITAIAAVVAAIAALYNGVNAWRSSEKNALLDNYTSEHLKDLHKMKKLASILLSEATYAVQNIGGRKDSEVRLKRIIESANEYAFILKPVYLRDEQTLLALLDLKNALVEFYNDSHIKNKRSYVGRIEQAGEQFRKRSFIYIYSSWTCIKKQILEGERSQYEEFNDVYTEYEKQIEEENLKEFLEFL